MEWPAPSAATNVDETKGESKLLDPDLQELAAYAAQVLGAPISLVTELGENRQTFLANVGFARDWTDLEESFCAHAVLQEGVFEVPDATIDPRFRDNPLVTGKAHVRFYAGAPVRTDAGTPTNALCVLDTEARELTDFQRKTLTMLARQVEARLQLRAHERDSERTIAESRRSAELLRMVTDRLPVRVAYVDREFRFRFVNDAYLAQVGLSREAALGRTLTECLGESMFAQARPNLERALAGEVHTKEFEALYNTGIRPVRATYVPDLDADGNIHGVVVQVVDLTEQRAAEAARRTNEERYRAVFESIDEGFCVMGIVRDGTGKAVDLRYLEVNPAFERATGLAASVALSGPTVRELVPNYETFWIETYDQVARTGEPAFVAGEAKGFDRWYEVRATRIGGSGSDQVAIVFNDVSERVLRERALDEARSRLDETLDRADVGVFEIDGATGILRANRRMAFLYGVPYREEGTPYAKYLASAHPDDREEIATRVAHSLTEGGAYETGYRVTDAEGQERSVLVRGKTVLDAAGQTLRITGVVLDVTARVRAEEARRESEARLRVALRGGRMGTWDIDTRAGTMECSDTCKANYGRRPDEPFSYAELGQVVLEEDRLAWRESVAAAIIDGRDFDMEYRVRWPDATIHWIQVRGSCMTDAAGAVIGLSGVSFEITEIKLAQERERAAARTIAEREELFRTVFEQAPDDAILIMDRDRTLTAWNPAAERIMGWRAEEAVGKPAELIFTPEDRAAGAVLDELFGAVLDGSAPDERWHVRRDGTRFWGSGTMNALHDAEGSVTGFLKVFRDATERHGAVETSRRLNEELESRVEQRTIDLQGAVASLAKAVQEAEGFNYAISHDLRSPLRAIAMTSGILMEEAGPNLSDEHRDLLERQVRAASRLAQLIDGLLHLSRLSRVDLKRQSIDMTLEARGVAMQESVCVVDVQEGMVAEGDSGLVHSVLQNLIGNACKFSPRGGYVTIGQQGEAFYVRDEGVGFDMSFAPKIFLPFERLVADDAFPGTGIGLANVKRIVERHGGRVWVESEPGKGSTFWFTLG